MRYVVDTHAMIWFLEGNSRLGANARIFLSDASSQLILPVIAVAEAAWIIERGKTSIPSVESLFNAINSDPIYPLDKAVVQKSVGLSKINEMHDRQIVATALVLEEQGEKATLLTCDKNIVDSGLVTVAW
jgi:PIN domain nuclease of toxin-antitoxin system